MAQQTQKLSAQWTRWHGRWSTRTLTIMGALIALGVLLSRLMAIPLGPSIRISFGFIPNAVAGMLLGPMPAMMVAGMADFLGAVLFPSGAYYFGFTLTAMTGGLLYGAFFYRRGFTLGRAVLCKLMIMVLCNVCLNTIWLHQLNGSAILAILPARLIKNVIQYPVDVVLLLGLAKMMRQVPQAMRDSL